jgi:carbon starvation protein
MLGAVVGIVLAPPDAKQVRMAEFTGFVHAVQGPLFPMLFVLVACGAISGFHSLVASGTTAKQLSCETDARPIGYGGMLIEGALAVVALGAIAAMTPEAVKELLGQGKKPGALFAIGVGKFIHAGLRFVPAGVATTFAALAVSAFALTSLDTGTRLGRFAFQELAAPRGDETKRTFVTNRFVATAVTTAGGAALVFSGSAWTIWPAFGAANQLLAALALLAVAVWLVARRRSSLFVKIPMVFMFVVTLSALVVNIVKRYRTGEYVLVAVQAVLLVFAVILVGLARKSLFSPAETEETTPQAA